MSSTPGQSAAHPPLRGSTLVLGTLSLSLATFMNVLDTSIANVSIPAISGDMGVSPAQGTWVITSFGVANAISVPLTGWLTQRIGAVRLFVASVVLFVLSSWLCGLATSIEMLIAMRVVQGFVAGPMNPLSQTLLMSSYPAARAGMALAMWSMTVLVAPVAGPLLGGWITDHVSWPWIFYINIPVGLIAAVATWAVYRRRETPIRKLPIDAVGMTLLVLWVGALQIMVDKGKELDWFASGQIVALGALALVAFAVFLAWELTDDHPVVDLRLFADRNFTVGTVAMSLGYGLFFGNVVLMPLWLQQFMGYTATQAGMALAPVGVLALLLTPLSGRNVTRWDPRWMVTGAFAIFALVMWLRAQFSTQTELASIMVPTVLQGAALAFFFVPVTALTLARVSPDRVAASAGLTNFLRLTAGAIGTSISTTLWDHRASMHHAHLTERLAQGDPVMQDAMDRLTQTGLSAQQALAQINRLIDQQAFTRAADDVFLASSFVFVLMIGLVWLARRPQPRAAAPVDAGAH